jgi:hypothetical protein
MSFTCGNPGTRGGIGLQIGQPGDQEVFIGVRSMATAMPTCP